MVRLYFPDNAPEIRYVYKDSNEDASRYKKERDQCYAERDECRTNFKSVEADREAQAQRVKALEEQLEAVILKTKNAMEINDLLVQRLRIAFSGGAEDEAMAEIWGRMEEVRENANSLDPRSVDFEGQKGKLDGEMDKLAQQLNTLQQQRNAKLLDNEKALRDCQEALGKGGEIPTGGLPGAAEHIDKMVARQQALTAVFDALKEKNIRSRDNLEELLILLEREESMSEADAKFLRGLESLATSLQYAPLRMEREPRLRINECRRELRGLLQRQRDDGDLPGLQNEINEKRAECRRLFPARVDIHAAPPTTETPLFEYPFVEAATGGGRVDDSHISPDPDRAPSMATAVHPPTTETSIFEYPITKAFAAGGGGPMHEDSSDDSTVHSPISPPYDTKAMIRAIPEAPDHLPPAPPLDIKTTMRGLSEDPALIDAGRRPDTPPSSSGMVVKGERPFTMAKDRTTVKKERKAMKRENEAAAAARAAAVKREKGWNMSSHYTPPATSPLSSVFTTHTPPLFDESTPVTYTKDIPGFVRRGPE